MLECISVRLTNSVKKVENKFEPYKETVECVHLILRPGTQGTVQCHTIILEMNQRATIYQVPLSVKVKPHYLIHAYVSQHATFFFMAAMRYFYM
jgi:hypothetical protein